MKIKIPYINYTACNFQSMKSFMDLNSLFSKFFCYITWFIITAVQNVTNKILLRDPNYVGDVVM